MTSILTPIISRRHGKVEAIKVHICNAFSGAPTRAKRAWDSPIFMVYGQPLFVHVIDRAYLRTYASTDCKGGVGETIKREGGVSHSLIVDH